MAAILVSPEKWTTASPIYTQLSYGNHVYNVHNAGSGYSYDVNATHALTSTDGNSIRFEVRSGDTNWYDIGSGKERSEISSTERIDYGTPLHVSYDFTLEPGPASTAVWVVLGQLHHAFTQDEDASPPPFAIEMRGEKMLAVIRYKDADGNLIDRNIFTDTSPIVRGHDYKMDIYASFDNSSNEGRLVIVRDGTVIADYKGPLGFSADGEVYWKEGIYRYHATETLSAVYSNLTIDYGDMVQIPAQGTSTHALADAPTLALQSTSITGEIATTVLSGTATAGRTVALYDGEKLIGTTIAGEDGRYGLVAEIGPGQHLFTAVSIDGAGSISATSREVPVEVGSAADVYARMNYLAAMPDLGAILLTGSHTLVVGSIAQMKSLIAEFPDSLSKIAGGYNFGFWSGTPNYRTLTTYDQSGQAIEAYTTSSRDGQALQLTHMIYTPGSYVTMEITAFHITGQPYTWAYRAFTTGNKMVTLEQYRADNTLYFASYVYQDGSKSVRTYDDAGVILTNTITDADGTVHVQQYSDGVLASQHTTHMDGSTSDTVFAGSPPPIVESPISQERADAIAKAHHGDDVYLVRSSSDAKGIFEAVNGGDDTVYTTLADFQLGANIEKLIYTGTRDAVLTGNSSDNVIIGGAWNDLIDGGSGADTMTGGAGNDTYVVENEKDLVVETAGGGFDTVRTTLSTYHLGANLEALVYLGTSDSLLFGNALANTILGGSGNDALDGGAGADDMAAGGGNDNYVVDNPGDKVVELADGGYDTVTSSVSFSLPDHVEKLVLIGSSAIDGTGNDLDNVIVGNDASNILDGGTGTDTLIGGGGNDVFIVDDTRDVVIEKSREGVDVVFSSVSHALSDNVENLTLTGSSDIQGTGNSLDNTIVGNVASNLLSGGAGNDVLDGLGGNDILRGGSGNDVLRGGDGNDILWGDAGADRLSGGSGADIFMLAPGDTGRTAGTADRILDFSHAQSDKIDFSQIDANSQLTGDQAFTFYADKPAAGIAGSLWMTSSYGYYQVYGDLNGDGMADIVLLVDTQNRSQLLASDFIL